MVRCGFPFIFLFYQILSQVFVCQADVLPPSHNSLNESTVKNQLRRRNLFALSLRKVFCPEGFSPAKTDAKLINWIKSNVSDRTSLPFSFQVPSEFKSMTYRNMGRTDSIEGIIERMIVAEGLDVYDGAVGQIVLTMQGGRENLLLAYLPVEVYWQGRLGELSNIRAGYPVNRFIYNPQQPEAVASDPEAKGRRGFIFRIINANGKYLSQDPLDGKTRLEEFPNWPSLHWEDWKPVAGENAWVVMAALHLYHKKYYEPITDTYKSVVNTAELLLAEELARAALLLRAENGGIRMAPLGTFRENTPGEQSQDDWWYRQISSENNLSWYSAFRMLYSISGKEIYKDAMDGIERYFREVWNDKEKIFYQGMTSDGKKWSPNAEYFALDVQSWGILVFGPKKIDDWFGPGMAFQIWERAKKLSGVRDNEGNLVGVGYTTENNRISVEWTAGAILAAKQLAFYYRDSYPDWAKQALRDARDMRYGIEQLRKELSADQAAYAYSSQRGWIPFGWNSHDPEVLSLASTGWVIFVDNQFNPFELSGAGERDILFRTAESYLQNQADQNNYPALFGL